MNDTEAVHEIMDIGNFTYNTPLKIGAAAATLGAVLALIVILTIFGNCMVLFAILFGGFLRKAQFLLIFSLAFTDLLLSLVVLPLSISYEVSGQRWRLGGSLCEFWISLDVLCCTASIWHLVAIALDRYRACKCVHYARNRPRRAVMLQIVIIWLAALVVALSPFLGWKDEKFDLRISMEECMMSQDVSYQFFSTTAAFFVPLVLIIYLYYKILRETRNRISMHIEGRFDRGNTEADLDLGGCSVTEFELTETNVGESSIGEMSSPMMHRASESTIRSIVKDTVANERTEIVDRKLTRSSLEEPARLNVVDNPLVRKISWQDHLYQAEQPALQYDAPQPIVEELQRKKQRAAMRRERRATRTLAILTGTFIICWFPFFVLAVVRPLCDCEWSRLVDSTTLWLGYINSTLNPIVYTIFSPDFRRTFKRMWRKLRRQNPF